MQERQSRQAVVRSPILRRSSTGCVRRVVADPKGLRQMLRDGGAEAVEVIAENKWHPIRSPEDWWTIVLGSGRRKGIERLTPEEVTAVKETNLAFIRDRRITRLETSALQAIATKNHYPSLATGCGAG